MRYLILAMSLLLSACADDVSSEAESSRPEEARPSVFDPLTSTLDRAAGVETTLRDAAAERRRQLEEQE